MRKTIVNAQNHKTFVPAEMEIFIDVKFGNHGHPFAYAICISQQGEPVLARGFKDVSFYARNLVRDTQMPHRVLVHLADLPDVAGTDDLVDMLQRDLKSIGKLFVGIEKRPSLWANRMTLVGLSEVFRRNKALQFDICLFEGLFADTAQHHMKDHIKNTAKKAGWKGAPHNPVSVCQSMAVLLYQFEIESAAA